MAESLFRVFDEDNSGALNFFEYLQVGFPQAYLGFTCESCKRLRMWKFWILKMTNSTGSSWLLIRTGEGLSTWMRSGTLSPASSGLQRWRRIRICYRPVLRISRASLTRMAMGTFPETNLSRMLLIPNSSQISSRNKRLNFDYDIMPSITKLLLFIVIYIAYITLSLELKLKYTMICDLVTEL